MGMKKNKKLYRLPAFFMAATMLFTSIPFSSVANAAGDAGMQENVSEVNLTEENETATAEGVLAEESVVTEEAAVTAEEATEEPSVEGVQTETGVSPEIDAQTVSDNQTEENNSNESEEKNTTNVQEEIAESEDPDANETDEADKISDEVTEGTVEEEKAGEESNEETFTLKINNGSIYYNSQEEESKDEENNTYVFKSGTEIGVTSEDEGFFDGWYNQNGECVSKRVNFYINITEDTELTAKWNNPVVNTILEGVSYTITNIGENPWTLEGDNVLKSYSGYCEFNLGITVPEDGAILKFDYRTSSEEDFDKFVVNHIGYSYDIIRQSGNTEYKTYVTTLSEGDQTIQFIYETDDTISKYEDCVYIRNISIEPLVDRDVEIKVTSANQNGGRVERAGTLKYGSEAAILAITNPDNYFMGWKNTASNGEIISYKEALSVPVVEEETYTAMFVSESEYKEDCENLIENNNGILSVTDVQGELFIPENGALKKHIYMPDSWEYGDSSYLTFQVNEEMEGDKYLTFDIYDPKDSLYIEYQGTEQGYANYSGTSYVQTGSFKLNKGCSITIGTTWGYEKTSRDAYIKNMKIVDASEDLEISAITNNKSLGTVIGGGSVAYGTSVTLKANPKNNCEFSYWMDERGNIVSYEKIFKVDAFYSTTYTAVFRTIEVDKASLNGILKDEAGIVKEIRMKGGEWLLQNNRLESPKSNDYYKIIEMDVEIPEGKCYKFSASGNNQYVFGSDYYCTVGDYLDNSRGFSPIPLTTGNHTVYIVYQAATPYAGMARVNEIAFTEIKGTATIKATCRKESDDIRDDVGDLLDGNVEGIGKYPIGRKITLKAPAIEGYYFYGWKEKYDYQICCVNPEMEMQVTDNIEYVASYDEMPTGVVDDNMTLLPEGAWRFGNKVASTSDGGKLTVNFTVSENDIKYLSFESENGYATTELSLYVDGEFYGNYGKYEQNGEKGIIPFSGGEHTVTWVAKTDENVLWLRNISLIDEESLKEEKFTIAVEKRGSSGSVEVIDSNGSSNNPAQTGGVEYNYGQEVTLKAIQAEGEHFLGWIAPDGTYIKDSEIKVTVKKNMIYKAYFTSDSIVNQYVNAVIADSKYGIQFNPSAWYVEPGYIDNLTYIKTSNGGHLSNVPLSAVITVPDGEEDMLSFDYYTMFNNYYEENKVEGYFSVHVNGKEELRIPYNQREEGNVYNVPLAAGTNTVEWNFIETENPNSDGWNLGICNIDITNAKYYTVNATANDNAYGTVTGNGKYVYNQSATLKAVPNKGYLFKEWQLDGETISNEAEYTFLVTEDSQYTAIFEADPDYKEDDNKDNSGQGDSDKEDKKEDNKNTHTHTAGEWIITKEATAKETGLKVKKCTVCGQEMEKEVLPKYKVSFNVKGTVPLQVKKSTKAIKVNLMDGDKVKSYKSSNTKVATVNKKGKITAKKTGKAKITVTTKKGAKATITIKVQKSPVKTKKITVDKKKLTLKKGKSYTLSVTKTPVTTLEKATFTTSNKKVATVNKKGKIVAKKKGTATITVKCGKKKKTVKVTVK